MKTKLIIKELTKKEMLEVNGGSEFSEGVFKLIGYVSAKVGLAMHVVGTLGAGRGY